jgi:hypothetical protein
MGKWIAVAGLVIVLATGLGWWNWRTSPMREMERSQKAAGDAKSWHYHNLHYFPASAPETFDIDTFCPAFQHTIRTGATDQNGNPRVIDSIIYFGRSYGRVDGQWVLSPGNAQGSLPIFECDRGSLGSDDNSLPYDAILADGSVRRGGVRSVGGETCRDYEIAVATSHDPAEKEFRFSMCINELDHLPRETRRTPPGASEERASDYSQWNAFSEPQLPADFPR